jgi:hypothetical protein
MIVITILIILDADTECLINSEFKIFRAVGCMTNITPGTIVSILLLQALPEPGVVFNINNNNAHTHTQNLCRVTSWFLCRVTCWFLCRVFAWFWETMLLRQLYNFESFRRLLLREQKGNITSSSEAHI